MTGEVRFGDDEPNGLASMLGGLIQANLAQQPGRERLLAGRATYAIVARDIDVAVSIRLGGGDVQVRNGVIGRPDVLIETDSETLIGLSSVPLRMGLPDVTKADGRAVSRKLLRGELKVKGIVLHPGKLARLNRLLSVV